GPAADRVDLLTVLAHELGHLLGLEDSVAEDPFTGSVMASALPVGVRRVHLDGLLAADDLPPAAGLALPLSGPDGPSERPSHAAQGPGPANQAEVAWGLQTLAEEENA